MSGPTAGVRALAFDIQGTAVDFHQPIIRMGAAINAEKCLFLDWSALAEQWRRRYRETMDAVIEGRRPWIRVDRIYREALDTLLDEERLGDHFDAAERDAINEIWNRLDPWPDSVAGLTRLRRRFTLAALSNGGMAAVIALVKHAGLPLDAVLSAELARGYKPAPVVYVTALDYLGLPAEAVMMVACHAYDLHAARAVGMRTAFVTRPLEFGQAGQPDAAPDSAFDIHARDFLHLADQLGA